MSHLTSPTLLRGRGLYRPFPLPGEEAELRRVESLALEARFELRPVDAKAGTWTMFRSPVFHCFFSLVGLT